MIRPSMRPRAATARNHARRLGWRVPHASLDRSPPLAASGGHQSIVWRTLGSQAGISIRPSGFGGTRGLQRFSAARAHRRARRPRVLVADGSRPEATLRVNVSASHARQVPVARHTATGADRSDSSTYPSLQPKRITGDQQSECWRVCCCGASGNNGLLRYSYGLGHHHPGAGHRCRGWWPPPGRTTNSPMTMDWPSCARR